jgi:hypothetical protein
MVASPEEVEGDYCFEQYYFLYLKLVRLSELLLPLYISFAIAYMVVA